MSISGIGGGYTFQQVDLMGGNDPVFEERAPEATPPTRHEDGHAVQKEIPASLAEVPDDSLPKNAMAPTGLFGDQDFSSVGGATSRIQVSTPSGFGTDESQQQVFTND